MNKKDHPFTILGAAVTVFVILAAVIVGLAWHGDINDESTPLIIMLFTLAGTTVPTILNLAKTEQVKKEQEQVRADLENGHYAANLEKALVNHPNVQITNGNGES